ncbi:hypothetical protein TW65_91050 [Stemphylium lycopersici]|nr:hypothetical protein TW65_91050 [Stemphylium lycopersici]
MRHFITEPSAATSAFPPCFLSTLLVLLVFATMNVVMLFFGAWTYSYPLLVLPPLIAALGIINLHSHLPTSSVNAIIATVNDVKTTSLLIWSLETERAEYDRSVSLVVPTASCTTPSSLYFDNEKAGVEEMDDKVTLYDDMEDSKSPSRCYTKLCCDAWAISAWAVVWSLLHSIYYRCIETGGSALFSSMTTTEALTLSLFNFWFLGHGADLLMDNEEKKRERQSLGLGQSITRGVIVAGKRGGDAGDFGSRGV